MQPPGTTEEHAPRKPRGRSGVIALVAAVAATAAVVLTAPADDHGSAAGGRPRRRAAADHGPGRARRRLGPDLPGDAGVPARADRAHRGLQRRRCGRHDRAEPVRPARGRPDRADDDRPDHDRRDRRRTSHRTRSTETTPLVRLTTDYQVVVVAADSPLTDVPGLASAMQADVAAVSISGGSAGGAEQILAGLIAQAVGADPAKVSYVAHSGGGEALTTVLSGPVDDRDLRALRDRAADRGRHRAGARGVQRRPAAVAARRAHAARVRAGRRSSRTGAASSRPPASPTSRSRPWRTCSSR